MPWIKHAASAKYQVLVNGRLYYTPADSPKQAVTKIAMRLSDMLKPSEMPQRVYLDQMVQDYEHASIPWPDEYPELIHAKSVEILRAIESVAPNGKLDWNGVDTAAKQYGIPASDMERLEQYATQVLTSEWGHEPLNPPEQPDNQTGEQMELPLGVARQAYHKDSNKGHPAAQAADHWRFAHRMRFVPMERLKDAMSDDMAFIMAKMDGESVAIYLANGQIETVTSKGTIRSNFPAIEEAGALLTKQGAKSAIFMAELYGVNDKGVPESYMKSSSNIRDPNSGQDSKLRLAVYDVIEVNDKEYENVGIEERMAIVQQYFKDGKSVHPVYGTPGGIKEAEGLWAQLDEKGWEGLVVYIGSEMLKVKKVVSYDMVIVAIEKSPRVIDRIGASLCAFIDKEGRFRLNGSVSGGFTDAEKVALYDWAERNKTSEDEERIWVDPFKEPIIVEVEAAEVNVKDRPKMDFKDGKWVYIEDDMSGVLRFPHLKQMRPDKKPTERDVSFDQLSIRESSEINHLVIGASIESIEGNMGKILDIIPESERSNACQVDVEWNAPLWGVIRSSRLHYTEIMRVFR